MRSIATVLGLGIACAALSSCGHSHNFNLGGAQGSPHGGRSRNPTHGQLTKPQAIAFASAVNLRSSDLPGFSASARHNRETEGEKRLGRQLLRCVGAAAENGLAEASSGDFERRGLASVLSVSSNVGVARTSAVAAKELGFAMTGVMFILSPFLQIVQGFDAQSTGIRLLPLVIAMMAGAVGSDWLSRRLGSKVMVTAGLFGAGASMLILSRASVDSMRIPLSAYAASVPARGE